MLVHVPLCFISLSFVFDVCLCKFSNVFILFVHFFFMIVLYSLCSFFLMIDFILFVHYVFDFLFENFIKLNLAASYETILVLVYTVCKRFV